MGSFPAKVWNPRCSQYSTHSPTPDRPCPLRGTGGLDVVGEGKAWMASSSSPTFSSTNCQCATIAASPFFAFKMASPSVSQIPPKTSRRRFSQKQAGPRRAFDILSILSLLACASALCPAMPARRMHRHACEDEAKGQTEVPGWCARRSSRNQDTPIKRGVSDATLNQKNIKTRGGVGRRQPHLANHLQRATSLIIVILAWEHVGSQQPSRLDCIGDLKASTVQGDAGVRRKRTAHHDRSVIARGATVRQNALRNYWLCFGRKRSEVDIAVDPVFPAQSHRPSNFSRESAGRRFLLDIHTHAHKEDADQRVHPRSLLDPSRLQSLTMASAGNEARVANEKQLPFALLAFLRDGPQCMTT